MRATARGSLQIHLIIRPILPVLAILPIIGPAPRIAR